MASPGWICCSRGKAYSEYIVKALVRHTALLPPPVHPAEFRPPWFKLFSAMTSFGVGGRGLNLSRFVNSRFVAWWYSLAMCYWPPPPPRAIFLYLCRFLGAAPDFAAACRRPEGVCVCDWVGGMGNFCLTQSAAVCIPVIESDTLSEDENQTKNTLSITLSHTIALAFEFTNPNKIQHAQVVNIALIGKSGVGKTTLANSICGTTDSRYSHETCGLQTFHSHWVGQVGSSRLHKSRRTRF